MADEPEPPVPGDRGKLAGLQSRPDLNGRRVEVREQVVGQDGAPRFRVELLFGAGAGTFLRVKAANLNLDKDHVLNPALNTLVAAMQALAPGATPAEERRDWAGLPEHVLMKVAETLVAQTEAGRAGWLKQVLGASEAVIQEQMAKRERDGNCCLLVFALVCKGWRKAQLKVGGRLRTRVDSDVAMPGQVALTKWALAEGCPREHENGLSMAAAAAQFGHLELVRWLIQEQGFAMDNWVMGRAASGGNLELVRWLRGEGCDWDAWTCKLAAQAGRLGVLQWLRANGCPWDASTCSQAAFNGHLAMLRWARENGCDWNAEACAAAAEHGRLEILQWLRAHGCPWNADTCNAAAQYGHLATLRWARENGCDWNAQTCYHAAAGGHLATLRWARENGCDWNADACMCAAEWGHLEVLQWLRANGCPWDSRTCHLAAQHGHLETLRWARQNGCDWSAQTCLDAAGNGHLEVLQWLRAEGCPWNFAACHFAVDGGHVETLRWARENGCPWIAQTRDLAAEKLGYTDNLGNLVDMNGNPPLFI